MRKHTLAVPNPNATNKESERIYWRLIKDQCNRCRRRGASPRLAWPDKDSRRHRHLRQTPFAAPALTAYYPSLQVLVPLLASPSSAANFGRNFDEVGERGGFCR